MAADHRRRDDDPFPSAPVNGSLRRLRVAAGGVLTLVIAAMVFADLFAGSFGIRSDYHSEPIILGSLMGGLLLILGIEVGSRWPWGSK